MLTREQEILDFEETERFSHGHLSDREPHSPLFPLVPSVYRASRVRMFGFVPQTSRQGRTAPERRRRFITALFIIAIVAMLITTNSRWVSYSPTVLLFFLAGMSLACVGALGRIWSNLYIAGRKTSELVVDGPYSFCRNPLYLFSAIGMFGVGLSTATLTIPAIMVLFFALYYPMIISLEEARLLQHHGHAFLTYQRHTPAFWPRFSSLTEPQAYSIFPIVFRRNLFDAFWFVALAALVHAECVWTLQNPDINLWQLW